MADAEVFDLMGLGRVFATRSQAKEIAKRFEEFVRTTQVETVVVGWDDVHAASPSFIDEFVSGIRDVMSGAPRRRTLVFSGDDDYVLELLDSILRRWEFPVHHVPSRHDLETNDWSTLGLSVGSSVTTR